jgi:hypothetical protein
VVSFLALLINCPNKKIGITPTSAWEFKTTFWKKLIEVWLQSRLFSSFFFNFCFLTILSGKHTKVHCSLFLEFKVIGEFWLEQYFTGL